MSGAPVVAAGRLLGVVTEHAPREGPSAITAVPLTALEQDPAHPGWGPGVKDPSAWWARLGVSGLADLQRLPAPPQSGRSRPIGRRCASSAGPCTSACRSCSAGSGSWPRSPPSPPVLPGIGGWSVGRMPARPRCCTRRSPPGCRTRWMWSATSCPVEPPTPTAAGSSPRSCPSWPTCARWIPRSRTETSSMRCGSEATERAAEIGRQLLLVVDGLDEDIRPAGLPSVASLLPTLVDGRAHVLVASRPHPELPVDVPDGHPLNADEHPRGPPAVRGCRGAGRPGAAGDRQPHPRCRRRHQPWTCSGS